MCLLQSNINFQPRNNNPFSGNKQATLSGAMMMFIAFYLLCFGVVGAYARTDEFCQQARRFPSGHCAKNIPDLYNPCRGKPADTSFSCILLPGRKLLLVNCARDWLVNCEDGTVTRFNDTAPEDCPSSTFVLSATNRTCRFPDLSTHAASL